MPYVETPDGVPLYYEEHGEGETILLIHGWTMNAEYWWQKNISPLADSSHIVAVDLRGHGLSSKTDDHHTLIHYARDIYHIIQLLGLIDIISIG